MKIFTGELFYLMHFKKNILSGVKYASFDKPLKLCQDIILTHLFEYQAGCIKTFDWMKVLTCLFLYLSALPPPPVMDDSVFDNRASTCMYLSMAFYPFLQILSE